MQIDGGIAGGAAEPVLFHVGLPWAPASCPTVCRWARRPTQTHLGGGMPTGNRSAPVTTTICR